ncbi:MAG TPA: DUF1573 domain-containing protein [Candidatus Binatia bacterium]
MRTALLVLLLALGSPVAADSLPPRIEALESVFDAGTVDAGTLIRHTFALRNAGGADLHVTVQPGCACTIVQADDTIAPGATGTVTATLDTVNYRGRIVKTVRVASDDPTNGSIGLAMKADVIPALAITPTDSPLVRGAAAELKPVELALASNDGQPFDVLRADADPVLAVHVAPDPAAAPPKTRYLLSISVKPDARAGRSGPIVTLVTSHPHAPPLTVRMNLDVTPAVTVEPKHLLLQASSPDAVQHVRITKASGPLAIQGVDPSEPALVTAITTLTAGHAYDLAVRYSGELLHGIKRDQVVVRTDDPGQPTIVVSIVVKP